MTVQEFEKLAESFNLPIKDNGLLIFAEGEDRVLVGITSDEKEKIDYFNTENKMLVDMPYFIGYSHEDNVAYYIIFTKNTKRIVADEKYRRIR